jgi:hypothetical protein
MSDSVVPRTEVAVAAGSDGDPITEQETPVGSCMGRQFQARIGVATR